MQINMTGISLSQVPEDCWHISASLAMNGQSLKDLPGCVTPLISNAKWFVSALANSDCSNVSSLVGLHSQLSGMEGLKNKPFH
jgi:hypothetical protein